MRPAECGYPGGISMRAELRNEQHIHAGENNLQIHSIHFVKSASIILNFNYTDSLTHIGEYELIEN